MDAWNNKKELIPVALKDAKNIIINRNHRGCLTSISFSYIFRGQLHNEIAYGKHANVFVDWFDRHKIIYVTTNNT